MADFSVDFVIASYDALKNFYNSSKLDECDITLRRKESFDNQQLMYSRLIDWSDSFRVRLLNDSDINKRLDLVLSYDLSNNIRNGVYISIPNGRGGTKMYNIIHEGNLEYYLKTKGLL